MGNSASAGKSGKGSPSSAHHLSPEDLHRLGDRHPFSDEELLRLAQCHRLAAVARTPLLLAAASADLPPPPPPARTPKTPSSPGAHGVEASNLAEEEALRDENRRRVERLRAAEGRILPRGFGRRLEAAAFGAALSSGAALSPEAEGEEEGGSGGGAEAKAKGALHDDAGESAPEEAVECGWRPEGARRPGGRASFVLPRGAPPPAAAAAAPGTHESAAAAAAALAAASGGMDALRIEDDSTTSSSSAASSAAGPHSTPPPPPPPPISLEDFLDGVAGCSGRRGHRPALSALFRCCSAGIRKTTQSLPSSPFGGGRNDAAALRADAGEVLDAAHRLALATAFLEEADDGDDGGVEADGWLPDEGGRGALAASLREYAKKRGAGGGGPAHLGLGSAASYDLTAPTSFASKDKDGAEAGDDDGGTKVSLDAFLEWAESSVPQLAAILPTFLHAVLFPGRPYPPSRTPFELPRLGSQQSAAFEGRGRGNASLFALACASPALGGPWHRLYSSESDGLSFARLLNSVVGYGGPTLLVVRTSFPSGGLFGAYTACPWTESGDFHGSSDCFLFRLRPSLGVHRPKHGPERNFMYCNPESRSKGYDGLPHGMGFGGTVDQGGQPRLFLSETFDGCAASSFDLTFEEGSLLPDGESKNFEIADLEVWGVGGESAVSAALEARVGHRKAADKKRRSRRRASQTLLEDLSGGVVAVQSKNFKHREEMRGRDGGAPGEEDLIKAAGSDGSV